MSNGTNAKEQRKQEKHVQETKDAHPFCINTLLCSLPADEISLPFLPFYPFEKQ